jgi:Restriction endonuclease/TIR domain
VSVLHEGDDIMKEETPLANRKISKVVLVYAAADAPTATLIKTELARRPDIELSLTTYEVQASNMEDQTPGITEKQVRNALRASSYLMILLSPHLVNSEWGTRELSAVLPKWLSYRDVTVLPVRIADCEIPAPLTAYQLFDLREDHQHQITHLLEILSRIPRIELSQLTERRFQQLVRDLLRKSGFTNIEEEVELRLFSDQIRTIDLKADYVSYDPFGIQVKESWVIEVKTYRSDRANFSSVKQLAAYLNQVSTGSRGLLITNSQLTSSTRELTDSLKVNQRTEIRVIEGTELKRLLLQHSDLVDKHFSQSRA